MKPNYRLFLEQVQLGLIDLDEAADALEAQAREIADLYEMNLAQIKTIKAYTALCDQLGRALESVRYRSLEDKPVDAALEAWRKSK